MSISESLAKPRFGANYIPAEGWAHAWMDINPDDVRADFNGLADLGLDHVRLLPLWPTLQPNRTYIREKALDDVRLVVQIAAEFDMAASVDVIQGHLSSFDFLPPWIDTWHRRNMFTNPDVISGEVALIGALGDRLDSLPNFLGFTLGNEINQFSSGPHPNPMPATTPEITTWLRTLLAAAKRSAPEKEHLHAEYDAAFYQDDHPFTPSQCAREGDVSAVHSWIFNGTAQRYGGMSLEANRHAEYMVELVRAFATDPNRPVWLQEVGAPSNCLTQQEMPDFLENTIRHVATTENLWGVTWWCSHDVSRSMADFPDLEYSLGLIDSERKIKPIGARFAEVIADLRANPVIAPKRDVAVEVTVDGEDTPLSRSALGPGGSVFEAWMDLARSAEEPTLVLSSDADRKSQMATVVQVENIGPVGGYQAVNTVVEESE